MKTSVEIRQKKANLVKLSRENLEKETRTQEDENAYNTMWAEIEKLTDEIQHSPLPWTQRLGFVLDRVGAEALAGPLAEYVASHAKEYVPLRPRRSVAGSTRDSRWRLLVNEEVEADL